LLHIHAYKDPAGKMQNGYVFAGKTLENPIFRQERLPKKGKIGYNY
jgi:hypothetical protein